MRLLDSSNGAKTAVLVFLVLLVACGGNSEDEATQLDGVKFLTVSSREHSDHDIDYPTEPPAGGDHLGIWHNCGTYTVPLLDEAAVHSLEHGAVWVTYRPDLGAEAVLVLSDRLAGRKKLLVSPHPNQTAPVVVTAWARQLDLEEPDDPRLDDFIDAYVDADTAPEAGVTCQGGIGRPPADPFGR